MSTPRATFSAQHWRRCNAGTVFEIAKTAAGYASTPTTLVNFGGTNGAPPSGSLIADAKGDLLGTTSGGGANDDGTVFEITASGFAVHGHCAFVAGPSGQSGAPPSVTLRDLLAGEATKISMADLLPGASASSGQSTAQGWCICSAGRVDRRRIRSSGRRRHGAPLIGVTV